MLVRTFFVLALMAVVAETFVRGSMALGMAALHHRALDAAQAQIIAAATTLQASVAAQIAAGKAGSDALIALPAPQPTCVASNASGCALIATTTIAAAPLASPAPAPSCGTSCTSYYQANDAIAEGRVSALVSTTVSSTTGVTFAQRSALVSFRTFNVAPYAALTGSLDGTLDALVPNGLGDDGGTAPGSTDGTLIDVVYQNSENPNATMPANVWQAHAYTAPPATSPWDR